MLDIGQTYSISFANITVSAAQDLFEILPPADASVAILKAEVGQQTDYGDAAAEGLELRFVRGEGTITNGSGGTNITPAPLQSGFAAAGSTTDRNNTTIMAVGTGTLTTLYATAFNIQIGWLYQPTPAEMIVVSGGDALTLELVGAPADAIDVSASIIFAEIGG